jgi:hypothetical protein
MKVTFLGISGGVQSTDSSNISFIPDLFFPYTV